MKKINEIGDVGAQHVIRGRERTTGDVLATKRGSAFSRKFKSGHERQAASLRFGQAERRMGSVSKPLIYRKRGISPPGRGSLSASTQRKYSALSQLLQEYRSGGRHLSVTFDQQDEEARKKARRVAKGEPAVAGGEDEGAEADIEQATTVVDSRKRPLHIIKKYGLPGSRTDDVTAGDIAGKNAPWWKRAAAHYKTFTQKSKSDMTPAETADQVEREAASKARSTYRSGMPGTQGRGGHAAGFGTLHTPPVTPGLAKRGALSVSARLGKLRSALQRNP